MARLPPPPYEAPLPLYDIDRLDSGDPLPLFDLEQIFATLDLEDSASCQPPAVRPAPSTSHRASAAVHVHSPLTLPRRLYYYESPTQTGYTHDW